MLDNDFRELRAELRKRGYYQKPTATMLVELGIHVLVAAGGLVVFLAASGWVVRVCGLVVWTAGSIGIGTNTHTSSHNATCDKRWVNQLLTYLGYPVYFGLSATYWCHKHVLVHHSAPNVMGVDNDADLSPLFATTMDEVRQSQGVRRFYYEHLQRFVFPAAVSMTLFGQQIAGCAYLVRSLRGSAGRTAHLLDAGALLAHLVTTLLIPMFFFRPAEVAVFYLGRNVLLSYAMFAVFAPAHFPPEAARLDKDLSKVNYPLAVTATTLDFRVGWFGRRMCSGLEYQIEHHLLPDISHRHYPAISGVVQEFCREHGLPYRQHGWGRAVWRSLSAIRTPGEVVRNL